MIVRRSFVLALALLAIGCGSHAGIAPTLGNVTPQIFQKQPFKSPWLVTKLARYTWPNQMVVGDKWYIWVADRGTTSITRIDLRGGARSFPISFQPFAITIGSDQNMWVASYRPGGIIARVTPAGVETDFSLNDNSAKIAEMVEGSDGAVWFPIVDNNGWAVGRIDTLGKYTLYPQIGVICLTAGPDGNLWFSDDINLNAMNTQGQIVAQYPLTNFLFNSTIGPDGNLWFTTGGSTLIRATTAGQITQFQAPAGEGANDITNWNGQLWMAGGANGSAALVSFDPSNQTWGTPIQSPEPLKRIIVGQDGNFWLTGMSASVVTYVNHVLTVNPTSIQLKLGGGNDGSATLNVSETNYNGTWIAEWNPAIVNVVQPSPGDFTVTAVGPGTGKVTINDTMRNFSKIPVAVQ